MGLPKICNMSFQQIVAELQEHGSLHLWKRATVAENEQLYVAELSLCQNPAAKPLHGIGVDKDSSMSACIDLLTNCREYLALSPDDRIAWCLDEEDGGV